MNRFTVEETNLLSIYHEGGKREVMENMILSILVDTFTSKISLPMQPVPQIGSISVS